MKLTQCITRLALFAGLACPLLATSAPDYPAAPIRWIVAYPAGGGSDVLSRTVSVVLQQQLGQSFVIDNRPGGGTQIGMSALIAAPADGYTVASADIATLAFNPYLYAKLSYDVEKSFTLVGGIARVPFVLAVKKDFPANTAAEFIDYARQHAGELSYGSAGPGSPHHVAMELLEQKTGIRLTHIPYKGAAPALQDLMSGQFDAMMLDLPGFLSNRNSGRFKVLGVALPARHTLLPEVPTLDEGGLKGVVAYSWQVMLVPKGTPAPVVRILEQKLRATVDSPEVREKLMQIGGEAMPLSSRETADLVHSENRKWAPIIKSANIKLD